MLQGCEIDSRFFDIINRSNTLGGKCCNMVTAHFTLSVKSAHCQLNVRQSVQCLGHILNLFPTYIVLYTLPVRYLLAQYT